MGDAFQTSVGESILQGAQVFNQAVAIYLQDRRSQANFEQRKKEAEELARVREDRLKMEREAFELEKEMADLRQQVMTAQIEKLQTETSFISSEQKRADFEANTRRMKAQVDSLEAQIKLSNDLRKQILGPNAAMVKNAEDSVVGTPFSDPELAGMEDLTMDDLRYTIRQATQAEMKVDMGGGDFLFMNDAEKAAAKSSIRRKGSLARKALAARTVESRKLIKSKIENVQGSLHDFQVQLNAFYNDQPSPTRKQLTDKADSTESGGASVDPRTQRIRALAAKFDDLDKTYAGNLPQGQLEVGEIENIAKELAALQKSDMDDKRTNELFQRIYLKLSTEDRKIFERKTREALQAYGR